MILKQKYPTHMTREIKTWNPKLVPENYADKDVTSCLWLHIEDRTDTYHPDLPGQAHMHRAQ